MSERDFRALSGEGAAHFMGVGGSGMAPLAELVLHSGRRVTGCDRRAGCAQDVIGRGAKVWSGHDPDHLADVAVLVISAAVSREHAEVRRARERGIPVFKRSEALGQWVNRGMVVAISGTHGKTSTTAMTTQLLVAGGLDPTGVVGGRVTPWGSNLRLGSDELFVVEADEFDRSFHALRPGVAVVTNIEADHLDVYGTLQGVYEAFRIFTDAVPHDGRVMVCGDDHGASTLLAGLGARGYGYGLNPGSQLRAVDIRFEGGGISFRVVEEGEGRGDFFLKMQGVHNVRNALGAAASARHLGVEWEAIRDGLGSFPGVERRYERLGTVRGVTLINDYAHHPTEIRVTLGAARDNLEREGTAAAKRRIVAVFQPHLYSRTRDFAAELGEALASADVVWVSGIDPAREDPIPGIRGELVADAARRAGGPEVHYRETLDELADALVAELAEGDLCFTLGCGSIGSLAPALLERMRALEAAVPRGGAAGHA